MNVDSMGTMTEVRERFDRIVSDEAKKYLIGNNKIKVVTSGSTIRLCFVGHENISFNMDEIANIKDDESFLAFISKKTLKDKPEEPKEETRDMLVGTGYTAVMDPIKEEPEKIDEPYMVQHLREEAKTNENVQRAISQVNHAPKMMPYAKTKTLAPKDNKQSGFAEVLVISVIVLVYLAIIVNLVIRLK